MDMLGGDGDGVLENKSNKNLQYIAKYRQNISTAQKYGHAKKKKNQNAAKNIMTMKKYKGDIFR